jgi:hypothetical protein
MRRRNTKEKPLRFDFSMESQNDEEVPLLLQR